MEEKEFYKDKKNENVEFTGERYIPGIEDDALAVEHMQRYQSVLQIVKGKKVLDIACGEGYGTELLSKEAKEITGIDIDAFVIQRAKKKYRRENLNYMVGDIAVIPFLDSSVDIVISFETIEHIEEEQQWRFLAEIKRVLKPNGVLVMSTPNKAIYSDKYQYHNKWHKKEFYKEEWKIFLQKAFAFFTLYHQYEEVVNIIENKEVSDGTVSFLGEEREGKYYIAVASNQSPLPLLSSEIRMRSEKEYERCILRIQQLQQEEEERNNHIRKLNQEIERRDSRILELQDGEISRNRHIVKLDGEIEEKNQYIRENRKQIQQLEIKLHYEEQEKLQIRELLEVYRREEEQYRKWQEEFIRLLEKLDRLEKKVQEERQRREEIQRIVSDYQEQIKTNEQEKKEIEQKLRNKEEQVESLMESEQELERMKHSRSWKIMSVVWKINSRLFPTGSRRRLCGKLLIRFMRYPVQSMKMLITPRKLKNFFYYLKKDGAAFVSQRVDESFVGAAIMPETLFLEQISTEKKDILQYKPLRFVYWEKPVVSIVIPVYNQFDYTYNCLRSVLNNSEEISYEIIVANDHSTDLTAQIAEIAENIKVITNKENLGFLKNCNRAAKAARGNYIFFLNNDTQVQPNWLKPLVDCMEEDFKIGLVGSKLVYADGRLQEAGGILWKDGSAWNYGNRSNSEDPEYNYKKEVDYISGAAIMIRKALWEKIGGFDERFAPAYCEDSDLGFAVRKHGYQVVYQPLSVIVHYEGISNGTDTTSGQKAYQIINQKKFFDKWKEVLEREHFPNAQHVFLSRERSRKKPILLMVDHYVPQYDKDAGSKTIFQYLKMFVHMGYQIKFIGDNFYRHEPYTTVLQQMGIEVLYGSYYANNWKKWIKENGAYISFVFFNRPHISVKYIDYIKNQTTAKIIYYGHDLHYLRERRRYELTKDKKALEDSKNWKEKEYKLMRQADVVYYPSDIEVKEIAKTDPSIHAKAILAYMFQDVVAEEYRFEERNDILFVGGFTHTPNVDAVLWFVRDVFPRIKKKISDIHFIIIGSNPPKEVKNLADEAVIVKGVVSDEELEQYYKKCRLSVVPLRYGAGMKGKVVEAMRYGVPVITTSIGAEGITGVEEIVCIADTEQLLSEKLIDLYQDAKKLSKMSAASYRYIQSHFSEEHAWQIVKEDFRKKGEESER